MIAHFASVWRKGTGTSKIVPAPCPLAYQDRPEVESPFPFSHPMAFRFSARLHHPASVKSDGTTAHPQPCIERCSSRPLSLSILYRATSDCLHKSTCFVCHRFGVCLRVSTRDEVTSRRPEPKGTGTNQMGSIILGRTSITLIPLAAMLTPVLHVIQLESRAKIGRLWALRTHTQVTLVTACPS